MGRPAKSKWAVFWQRHGGTLLACVPIGTLAVGVFGLWHSVSKTNEDFAIDRKAAWQKTVILSIIEDAFFHEGQSKKGIAFKDLKARYEAAATTNQVLIKFAALTKDDLSEVALRKLLIELTNQGVVLQMFPGESYGVPLAHVNSRQDRSNIQMDLRFAVIHELTLNPGKYTSADLSNAVMDKVGAKTEEYNYILNELLANGMVTVTSESKGQKKLVLWTRANCPTCPLFDTASEPPVKDVEMKKKVIPDQP